jgi:hypothetical protein
MASMLANFLSRAVDDHRTATAVPHLLALLDDASDVLRLTESRKFFRRCLCPLVTVPGFIAFSDQLFLMISRFIAADTHVLPFFIRYLIAHWPIRDHEKQEVFLGGLRDIILEFIPQMPRDVAALCIAKVADIVTDCIPDLANQAMSLLMADRIAAALARLPRSVAAAVWRQAEAVAREHWLDSTRTLGQELIAFLGAANLGNADAVTGGRGAVEKWRVVRAMADKNWDSNQTASAVCEML